MFFLSGSDVEISLSTICVALFSFDLHLAGPVALVIEVGGILKLIDLLVI